jgi:hypothetical protein
VARQPSVCTSTLRSNSVASLAMAAA